MASFPGSIYPVPSFGTNLSDTKTHTTWRDEITDEVRAIELELGTTPSGAAATVASRLSTLDTTVAGKLPLAGGTMTGQISGITPTAAAHLTRKDYVDTKLPLAGGTLTGAVLGVTPTAAAHLTRKDYVDAQILAAAFVELAGDTMTGKLLINAAAGATPLELRNSTQDPKVDFQHTGGTRFGYVSGDSTGIDVFSAADLVFFTDNTQRARMDSAILLLGKSLTNLATAGAELHMGGSSAVGSIRSTISAASIQNYYARHEGSADANGQAFDQYLSGSSVVGSVTQVSTTGVAFNTTSDERLKTVLRDLDDDEIATILRLIAPVVFEFNSDPGNQHVGFIAQQLAATWPQFVDVGIVTVGHGEPGDVEVVEWDEEPVLQTVQLLATVPVIDPDTGEQAVDEDGQPVFVSEPRVDIHGRPVTREIVATDADGNPLMRRVNERLVQRGFVPWLVDLSKLVPLLVAGWQQLDRRVATLEGAAA